MSDTISRAMAIREYQEVCKGIKCGECPLLIKVNTEKGSHLITDCKLEAFLHDLPSAQPERKKGKWINRSLNILYPAFERYTCSVCGKHSYSYDFCPNCGSYNGGENHDKG